MEPTLAGLISFGLAGLAFAGLAVLALTQRFAGLTGRLFLSVVLVQSLWAMVMALSVTGLSLSPTVLTLTEATRVFAWTAFLLSIRRNAQSRSGRIDPVLVAASLFAVAGVLGEWAGLGVQLSLAIRLLAVTLVLLVLEQLYRSGDLSQRWALKFLAVAAACMFGFDLLMYSEALLFERLNAAWWMSRGFANALVVPLLAVAAARNRAWTLGISVSRRIVFHSATLIIVGTYLSAIAAGAYYVRYFGGSWGEIAQTVLLFGAVIGLLVVGLSGSVRASIRVFVSKHFFHYQYDYREEWLRLTRLLAGAGTGGTSSDALARRGIAGLASLVESDGGALWLREADRFELAGQVGRTRVPQVLPASNPMLDWIAKRQWVVDLREWRDDPGHYPGLSIDASLDDPGAWLIVPMVINDDLAGFAVLDLPNARVDVDWEVRDVLKAAGAQVASFLGVRRAADRLAQSAQFESFNRMSAFVVHDLKNLVSQLSLLLRNAQKHGHDPAFIEDMLGTIGTAVERMRSMLGQLHGDHRDAGPRVIVDIDQVIERALRSKRDYRPKPVRVDQGPSPDARIEAHPDRLERVLGHLLQNAVEACQETREPRVELRRTVESGQVRIDLVDNGKGMSEAFMREQLFRPFNSTKAHGMGIGLFESREYIHELGGSLNVESAPDAGTRVTLRIPLVSPEPTGTSDG